MNIVEKIKNWRKVNIILLFMVIGLFFSSLAILYTLARHAGLAHDKAIYFNEEYSSTFEVREDTDDEVNELIFESELTDDKDERKAVIEYDGNTMKIEMDSEGKVKNKDKFYLFLWWEEEDSQFVEGANGYSRAILSKYPEKKIIDPTGIFLNQSQEYTAVCTQSIVYLKGIYATQASYIYEIKRNSDDKLVGEAIVDMTSGIAFELNIFEEGQPSFQMVLEETDYPISRNRHAHIFWASVSYIACFALLLIFLKKEMEFEGEELKEMVLVGGIGFFAFWLDLFYDMWYTTSLLMPLTLILHFIPTLLILAFKREWIRFTVIPLIEMGFFVVFLGWNMDLYVLWLATGNICLWLALIVHFRKINE